MRTLPMSNLCALLCSSLIGTGAMAHEKITPLAPRIVGGSPSKACGWPSTVGVGNCTGTLVHPSLVVYAAHCGAKIGEVVFGPSIKEPARVVPTSHCETYPGGGVLGDDVAFCTLEQEVTDIPITPPAMGPETKLIQKDQAVWAVGFGYYNQDRDYGIKHEVKLSITGFANEAQSILIAGGNGKDACQGDSGGPLFMELPQDRGFRLIGITSFGFEGGQDSEALPCGFGGGWAVLHHHVDWIEAQSGIDITPCHDPQGNPDPNQRCGIAPLSPADGSGQWPDDCTFGQQTPPLKNLPPAIRWSEAVSTSPRVIGQAFDVELEVSDDDGIEMVELFVNGSSQGQLSQAPYRWSFDIPDANELELSAYAMDSAGQKSEAKKLALPLKVRTDTNPDGPTSTNPDAPDTAGNPPSPTSPKEPDSPGEAIPPSPPQAPTRACTQGQAPPCALLLGSLLLLWRRRRTE